MCLAKYTPIWMIVMVLVSGPADAKPLWVPVPGHPGVFVDVTSIHREHLPVIQHAYPTAPNPDTGVDIMVNGHIAQDTMFYCDDATMILGDEQFGEITNNGVKQEGIVPVTAARPIVCGRK
jgi:hypothetical protein